MSTKLYFIKIITLYLCFTLYSLNVKSQICLNDLEKQDALYTQNNQPFSGRYTCKNSKGLIVADGFVKNGLLDSISVMYDDNGKIKAKFNYNKGVVINRMICEEDPFYRTCISYKGDIMHGVWEKYYKNDSLRERRYYENGEPSGSWTVWDKKQIPFVESYFTADSMFQTTHQYRKHKHIILYEKASRARPQRIQRERKVIKYDK
jgi:antitoxin component YwqK of YwqJK toxin-antitoxin module